MRVFVTAWVMLTLLGGVVSQAANPATKPAKPDPNSVEESFDDFGFKLAVPKAWKPQKKDNSLICQVPGGGFIVVAGRVKEDLKTVVDGKKKRLEGSMKGLKFTKDEATTLGGNEAWLLQYDAQLNARESTQVNGQDAGGTHNVTIGSKAMEITSIKDGIYVQVSFVSGDKVFDGQLKNAQRVLGSFEWTTPKAGDAKPADEKKQ